MINHISYIKQKTSFVFIIKKEYAMIKILIALCCLLSFVGCAVENTEIVTSLDTSNELNSELNSTQVEYNADDYNLNMVTGTFTAFETAATKNGTYYKDISTNAIAYMEAESEVSAILCNRLDCAHNDETCTAYMPTVYYKMFLNYEENTLFTVRGESYEPDYIPIYIIDRMDINGENRKEILRLENVYLYNIFANNADDIYYIYNDFNQEKESYDYFLDVTNASKGESENVEIFAKPTKIIGAYNEFLILAQSDNDLFENNEIIKYNVATKEQTKLATSTSTNPIFANENKLYFFKSTGEKTATITERDLITEEDRIVAENIMCYGEFTYTSEGVIFVDDYIIVSSSVPPTTDTLILHVDVVAVDIDTGEQTEIFLNDNYGMPRSIRGETDTHYVLLYGFADKTVEVIVDGTIEYIDGSFLQYALIEKADYLQSKANYIMLAD